MTQEPPQPRDYSDYDDYRSALEEWEWQQDQLDDPDGSKACESQERRETWARFHAEGRVPRCIPSCRKPLCLEREGCIWVELQIIQEILNTDTFGGKVSRDRFLIQSDAIEERVKRGLCSVLPPAWQKDGAREHRVLCFFLNVWDHLSLEIHTDTVNAFWRDTYMFVFSELRGVSFIDMPSTIKRIKSFLCDCPDIPRIASTMLLSEFEGLVGSENNEWPPGTESDLAGMLIDPTGKTPVRISDSPDPKSFASFEEYKEALALRDDFLEKAEVISSILSSGKSEEEIDEAMAALGFQKHEDAQNTFEEYFDQTGSDIHGHDGDNDGKAC